MVWQSYSCVVTALSHTALPSGSAPRDVHRNFEGPLLCPGKKGQHVHFCQAPSPWTHILPTSLETVKLSGSITNRRHSPAHIFSDFFYLGRHEILQPLYYEEGRWAVGP